MHAPSSSRSLSIGLVVGCCALMLAAGGCDNTVSFAPGGGGSGAAGGGGSTGGAAGSSVPPGCPEWKPSFDGSDACASEGQHCDYDEVCCHGGCLPAYSCDCDGGTWVCWDAGPCRGCDPGLPNVDDDLDGFTEEQGDCDDCSPTVNLNAAEVLAEPDPNDPDAPIPSPADEDCDGLIDMDDPDLQPCDGGLALDSEAPIDGVKAIGLCDLHPDGTPKFVKKATWVLADGSPPGPEIDMARYHLGHGLLDHFGLADVPQEGARMLALSSGTARNEDEAGFVSRNFDKMYSSPPPLLFGGETTACPGVLLSTESVQDAAGLEVEVMAPSNALAIELSFHYRTYDFPQYFCSPYSDFFWINFVQGNTQKNLSADPFGDPIGASAAMFPQCDCPPAGPGPCGVPPSPVFDCQGADLLAGTDYDGSTNPIAYAGWTNAGTGWLTTTTPVVANQLFKLRFTVFDSGVTPQGVKDHLLDSLVTVDRFRWHGVPGESFSLEE